MLRTMRTVTIELLGPLRVDGQDVSLQRRDHVVFLALAVRAGEVVPAERLAEALWGEALPASWQKVVQGCVVRLRRRFGQALIETAPAGYRLAVAGEALDTWRFEELIQRGRLLAAAGEFDRAAVACGRALELWRGRPFEVLDGWAPGQIEASRLAELRRAAEESVLEARLHSGEHREVVPIAEARVSEEPLREHRWALLALALYRCGRQADALRTLKRARTTLVEQLGIEPSAELVALEAAILRQDETLLAPPAPPTISDQCPYKGLAPYDVDDTETFFGRDGEIDNCVERLHMNPLLVVTGPSGCGKSSLVRAGVVPALRRIGRDVALFQPGSDAEAAMASAVASCDGAPVLVVDQFEELLAFDDESGTRLRGFCARLAEYATDIAPVVITIRADHVAALAVDPDFAQLAERGLHLVTPLAGDGLRQAIEGPAELAGLRLEPGLVDLLVRDSEGEPGALPLLSHALAETWQRRDGRVLTVEGYRATGEIRGAVARSADRLYESLPADQRPRLRSVLLRLVSSSPNGEPVRTRVATRVLGGDADRQRLLGLLVRARLVTAQEDTVELAHEALARAWPRLRSWLDEDAAGQRILSHLAAAADGWESLGRPRSELYRGARLETALEWQAATSPDLTAQEATFIAASVAEAEAERQRHTDQLRAQARQTRRLRRALAGVAVLVIVATAGGVAAYQQRETNQRDRRDAAVQALVSQTEVLRSSQPELAALIAAEAYRTAPSALTESALFGTFTAAAVPPRTRHTDLDIGFGASAAMVPNSDSLAVADRHGLVHVVDIATGETAPLSPITDVSGKTEIAASADGRYVAGLWRPIVNQDHSMLTVWDVRTGKQRFDPIRIDHVARSLAISSDGSYVVVGRSTGPDQIRDGTTGALQWEIEPLTPPTDAGIVDTDSVEIVPDGRVVVFSRSGPIRFIDPVTGTELQRIDAPRGAAFHAAFLSSDGSTLVTVGTDGFTSWDVGRGAAMSESPQPVDGCSTTALVEQLNALLCAPRSGPMIAYNLRTGTEVQRFDAPPDDVCALVVSADGATLAKLSSCAGGATITEWRLDGTGPVNWLAYTATAGHLVEQYRHAGDPSLLIAVVDPDDPDVDAETIVLNPRSGEVTDRFPEAFNLLATDDPNLAIATFADGSIATYDVVNHELAGPSVDPGFPADGTTLSGGHIVAWGWDDDNHLQIQGVDLESGQLVTPAIHPDADFEIEGFLTTPESLYLAVTVEDGSSRVERRDLATNELLETSTEGYWNFEYRGGVFVARTVDRRIFQLDPTSLQPIGEPFPGITEVNGMWRLSEDGSRFLVVDGDPRPTMRIYDVATRTMLGDPIKVVHDPEHAWAAIRPDGLEVAVDTVDGIVIWDLDPQHWIDAVCDITGRNLTQAEWDEYIGHLASYHQTCPAYPTA